MSAFYLSSSFAVQSPFVADAVRCGRGMAVLLEAGNYPSAGTVRIAGLLPGRHYRVRGEGGGCCRADADGGVEVAACLGHATLLVIEPVI